MPKFKCMGCGQVFYDLTSFMIHAGDIHAGEPQKPPVYIPEGVVQGAHLNPKQIGHDPVNSPSHYTKGGIEPLEYIQAKLTAEQYDGYLIGNILKYVSRWQHKNGVEDLKKAAFHLDRLIEGQQ